MGHTKEFYKKRAGDDDFQIHERDEFHDRLADAKQAYASGDPDQAWGIYNELLTDPKNQRVETGNDFLQWQWSVKRHMTIHVLGEERYQNGLLHGLVLAMIEISQSYTENDFEGIAPDTVKMIGDAIEYGDIGQDRFTEIFERAIQQLKTLVEQARKLERSNSIGGGVQDFDSEQLKQSLIDELYS